MANVTRPHHSKIFRGTLEEVLSHRNEIPTGATVELKVVTTRSGKTETDDRSVAEPVNPKVLKALGMLTGKTDTEDFMRRKHEDTLLEDMPTGERSRP